MTISAHVFEACLRCPTKGWLRSTGEPTAGNTYAEWVATQDESCRLSGIKRLTVGLPDGAWTAAPAAEKLKTAPWQLATDVPVRAASLETRLHVVERVPSPGRGRAAQFILLLRIVKIQTKLHLDREGPLLMAAIVNGQGKKSLKLFGRIRHADTVSGCSLQDRGA